MKRLLALTSTAVGLGGVRGFAQEAPQVTPEYRDAFTKALEFLYTIAHWIGQLIAGIIHAIIPAVTVPVSLIDAIGFLALLTVFLAVTEIAKRLAWIVVVVGWALIVVRIVMVVVQGG